MIRARLGSAYLGLAWPGSWLQAGPEQHYLEETPFLKGVDPKGILQNMANGDGTVSYVHTEDNQV